jgi:pyruvate dehydrogenase E2 component (dihydrolipoamide acetyltransferase)
MLETRPLSRMRRAIAKTMAVSATIPQFGIEMDLAVAELTAARRRVDAAGRPSVVDALVASCAQALRERPGINVSFTDEGIVHHDDVNVAIALAVDDGLISPVIERADSRTIVELAAERVRLTESAKAGTLAPQEILSGSFTISNLGPFGVRRFTALVVPPQAAILAVGGISEGRMALTLSVDHRPIDGAPAARFLAQICAQLEDPAWLSELFAVAVGREAAT